jgi:hypothetical protein
MKKVQICTLTQRDNARDYVDMGSDPVLTAFRSNEM